MTIFMITGSYSAEGVKGLTEEGAVSRRDIIEGLTKHLGGSLVSAYWAAGGEDHFFVTVDVPNGDNLAALWMAVDASGAARVNSITQLWTAEQFDEARAQVPGYRAPGA